MFDREDPAGKSIVVAMNAGGGPARLNFEHPGLAGRLAQQVSWPGRGWSTAFASRLLETGALEVELEAREGVVIEAVPNL
jgi:hypothetical protein